MKEFGTVTKKYVYAPNFRCKIWSLIFCGIGLIPLLLDLLNQTSFNAITIILTLMNLASIAAYILVIIGTFSRRRNTNILIASLYIFFIMALRPIIVEVFLYWSGIDRSIRAILLLALKAGTLGCLLKGLLNGGFDYRLKGRLAWMGLASAFGDICFYGFAFISDVPIILPSYVTIILPSIILFIIIISIKESQSCARCGTSIADDELFCSKCGQKLNLPSQTVEVRADICSICGATLENGDLFCSACGKAVPTQKQ